MSSFAESLTDSQRRRFRLYAYGSTWLGCFSDVMIDSSAIVILYFSMLGASNTLTMLSTSLVAVASAILMIPASGFVNKYGAKKVVAFSCWVGAASCLLMAASPFFGSAAAKYVAFAGCWFYCVSKALWPSAWYVVLGSILLPKERGSFLGFMRFSYYILTGTVFFLIGLVMGKNPPEWLLQVVIAVIGIMVMGRTFFISKIMLPEHTTGSLNLGRSFGGVVKNGALVGFSVYICFMCFAFAAVLPLALLYLKSGLGFGDNVVQIISSVGIAGLVSGFFVYGKIERVFGVKKIQIFVHALYVIVPLCLFFCGKDTPFLTPVSTILVFAGNFAFACFYCYLSQEILALSRPENMAMSSSFAQTYQFVGTACGRGMASILLGGGILSTSWNFGGFDISNFQTIFLFCAGLAVFGLAMVFCLPSIVSQREDYYRP